jgi:hypothetical protein
VTEKTLESGMRDLSDAMARFGTALHTKLVVALTSDADHVAMLWAGVERPLLSTLWAWMRNEP